MHCCVTGINIDIDIFGIKRQIVNKYKNKTGLKTDSCGTPDFTVCVVDLRFVF